MRNEVDSVTALCPGEDAFLAAADDLSNDAFRKVVVQRARKVMSDFEEQLGGDAETRTIEAAVEKINLEPDFLPAGYLAKGAERAQAVCRIRTSSSFGTGFLIAPGLLMTNNHVVESEVTASATTAEFGFEAGGSVTRVVLQPDRLFMTNAQLDVTIVACHPTGLENITPIPLLQDPATITRHERVGIIQHPQARPKEIAIHDNRVTRVMDRVVRYSTDTEPGSSGSPVFNSEWELVALHHAGFMQSGGRASNEGIRITAIVAWLMTRIQQERFADRELRQLMGDLAPPPQLGFFGTEGIVDADDQEVVVDDFVGSAEFADVGVWNIEHFNDRVSDTRVRDVADVLHGLNVDVMGLTEVQAGAMTRLRQQLVRLGTMAEFELLDVRGSQDQAVLYNAETTTVRPMPQLAQRYARKLKKKTSTGRRVFPRQPFFVECQVRDVSTGRSALFLMILVHLKAFGDAQSRQRRRMSAEILAEVIEDIRERDGIPTILGGDMNQDLTTDVLDALKSSPDLFALTQDDADSNDPAAISYVGDRHRSLIDHIIVSRDTQLGDISGDDAAIVRLDRTVSDFSDRVSDHVPVICRLIFRDSPVPVNPEDEVPEHQLEIPSGSDRMEVRFTAANDNGSTRRESRKRSKSKA